MCSKQWPNLAPEESLSGKEAMRQLKLCARSISCSQLSFGLSEYGPGSDMVWHDAGDGPSGALERLCDHMVQQGDWGLEQQRVWCLAACRQSSHRLVLNLLWLDLWRRLQEEAAGLPPDMLLGGLHPGYERGPSLFERGWVAMHCLPVQ